MTPDLLSQIRLAGLPPPETEIRVCKHRRWRWDFFWGKEKICAEFQGGTWSKGAHVRGKQYRSDCEKLIEGNP